METVTLEGVKYVKASAVAKEFRYTADYVGQLCRGGKLDAKLVGRTWFVNPTSLVDHKKQKKLRRAALTTVRPSETIPVTSSDKKPQRTKVLPTISNQAARVIADHNAKSRHIERRNLRVSYEPDEGSLMPELIRKQTPPPKTVRIVPAGAKKVRVANKNKDFSFTASELPEVSLKGELRVTDMPDVEPETESAEEKSDTTRDMAENKDISPEQDKSIINDILDEVKEKADVIATTYEDVVNSVMEEFEDEKEPKTKPAEPIKQNKVETRSPQKKVAMTKPQPITQKSLKSNDLKIVGLSREVEAVQISRIALVSPLLATVFATLLVLLIFSASSKVIATNSEYHSQVTFQVANLLELVSQ